MVDFFLKDDKSFAGNFIRREKNRVMAQFFKAKPGLKNLQLEGCSI